MQLLKARKERSGLSRGSSEATDMRQREKSMQEERVLRLKRQE